MTLKRLIIETGTFLGATYLASQDIETSIISTTMGMGLLSILELSDKYSNKKINKKLQEKLNIESLEKIPTKNIFLKPIITGTITGLLFGTIGYFTPKIMPHLKSIYPTGEMYEESLKTTEKGKKNTPLNTVFLGVLISSLLIRRKEKYVLADSTNDKEYGLITTKNLMKEKNSHYETKLENALRKANSIKFKTTKEETYSKYLENQNLENKKIIYRDNKRLATEELELILNNLNEKDEFKNFVKSTYLPFKNVEKELMRIAFNGRYTTQKGRKLIREYSTRRS